MPEVPPPSAPTPGGKDPRREPSPLVFMGAGLEFAATTALLALLGWWLDKKLGSTPWLTLTGMGLGIVGGTYRLWRMGKRFFQ